MLISITVAAGRETEMQRVRADSRRQKGLDSISVLGVAGHSLTLAFII